MFVTAEQASQGNWHWCSSESWLRQATQRHSSLWIQAGSICTWAPPIPGLHVRILVFLQVLHIRVMYVALCCTHKRQGMLQ